MSNHLKKLGTGAGAAIILSLIATGIVSFDDKCLSPPLTKNPSASNSNLGPMNIILPDNKCERLDGIVLTPTDFDRLKNNVFVGTVLPRPVPNTSLPTTHDYCEISAWIWDGQLDENRKRLDNLLRYMFLEDCIPTLWKYTELPTWYQSVFQWYIDEQVTDQDIVLGVEFLQR